MNADGLARADVSALLPDYDSKNEAWYARYGDMLLGSEIGSPIVLTQYHPFTVHLPGGSYTFDFLHVAQDGRLICVEVKGSKAQRGYRDARSKLRAAAELYRWAMWYEVRCDGRGAFEIEHIEG